MNRGCGEMSFRKTGAQRGTSMRRLLAAAVIVLSCLVSGCSTFAYYAQAVSGHFEMIGQARPLDAVERDPATPERLKERLALAREIREFASRELGLPDNGSYRRYADIGRPFVVWNVFSTPEFSIEPIEHCFPVAGCVVYRGYYAEADARREAAREAALGRDAYVGGVPAYSTLGWFDDPLLSSFVFQPEVELARLIFHELAHQVAYASSDSVFNESFASVVEEEGVRRWLAQRAGSPRTPSGGAAGAASFQQYEIARARRHAFTDLLLGYRARLKTLFNSPGDDASRRRGKAALFSALAEDYARLKASWDGFPGYDRIMAGANNALLASVASYNALVPALSELLDRQQRDLPAFYREVKALARLTKAERMKRFGLKPEQDPVARRIEHPLAWKA